MIKISGTNLFFILIFLLTACSTSKNIENTLKDGNKLEENKKVFNNKETIEVKITCKDIEIDKFLKEGWSIVKETSEEKVCSWKSFPATKNCNMDKDKGCKVTEPDKLGEQRTYILER